MRSSDPLISVILPSFNTEEYIKDAIDSILNQTFKDFELIIADDGSDDNTKQIIDSYHDHRILRKHNEVNIGKIKTVEKLYNFAKGDFIVFHDADDISHTTRFEKQIAHFNSNKKLGIVGCGYLMIDDKNVLINATRPNTTHNEIIRHIRMQSQFHFPACMFKKSEIDQQPQIFNPYFGNNNEDIDLCYRILVHSEGYNINEILYIYRILPESISRKNILRNSYFNYKIVSELAEMRLNKCEGNEIHWIKLLEEKYDILRNKEKVTLYANSALYYISFGLYTKVYKVIKLSWEFLPIWTSAKLSIMVLIKAIKNISLFHKKSTEVDFDMFQQRRY